MAKVTVGITTNYRTASMAKQLPFAVAKGLTDTAKDSQKAILSGLDKHFTLRGNWFNPSNRFGIKIQPATKQNLTARVGTMADWLIIQEEGGIKTPRSGKNLAIPSPNVRRNKRDIIIKSQRPRGLQRTVVLKTKSGDALFQRKYKGKRSTLVYLYTLEPRAAIKKNSGVIEPALKSVELNLNKNISKALEFAFKTAK